jgi:geranylgeranyl diphosphate synthase type II
MVDPQTPSVAEYRARLGPQIEAALGAVASLPEGCPGRLRDAIRYALLGGGKRLRPMLVLLAAEACGGTPDAAMPAACAVEMIHAYSLVHDDLPAMDDDDLRRGRPTCHKVFGEGMAILAGDALLALAFQVLAEGVKPPAVAAACTAALAEAAGPCRLVGGQADDLDAGVGDLALLESIHQRKTGALIRVSLRLGGGCVRRPRAIAFGPGRVWVPPGIGLPSHRRPAGRSQQPRGGRQTGRQGRGQGKTHFPAASRC